MKTLRFALMGGLCWTLFAPSSVQAETRHWIGKDGSWQQSLNWNLNIAEEIAGTPEAGDNVTIDPSESRDVWLEADTAPIESLRVMNSSQVLTNGHQLNAEGAIDVKDATSVVVTPTEDGSPGLVTDRLSQTGPGTSTVDVRGGHIRIGDEISQGADDRIIGNGLIEIGSEGSANFVNYGTTRVLPLAGGERTLTFRVADDVVLGMGNGEVPQGSFDVDGLWPGETNRHRLVFDGPTTGSFRGELKIGAADTAEFTHPWSSIQQTILMNGDGATATLTGAKATLNGSRIVTRLETFNVIESELDMDNAKLELEPDSKLEFAGPTSIDSDTQFLVSGDDNTLVFSDVATIRQSILKHDFDWSSFDTEVRGGDLTLIVDMISVSDNGYDADLLVEDGSVNMNINPDLNDHMGAWQSEGSIELQSGMLNGNHFVNNGTLSGNGLLNTDGWSNWQLIRAEGGTLELDAIHGRDGNFISRLAPFPHSAVEARFGDVSVLATYVDPQFKGRLSVANGHTFSSAQEVIAIAEDAGIVEIN
ncbi:MAG: hypothetical protein AAF497_26955, partial [Planctomycetota bacterium]